VIRTWMNLSEQEYQVANSAHMSNSPVYFRGLLSRTARRQWMELTGPFLLVQRETRAQAS
jgi:hypothetical protein